MRFFVVFTAALVLEIGSTFYINSVANLDLDRMILWSFLGPFIALPFSGFIADERIVFQAESPGLSAVWKKLAARRSSSPKLWMDAYLAAAQAQGQWAGAEDARRR